jgi:PqqD family protein of HPr-rel-A system
MSDAPEQIPELRWRSVAPDTLDWVEWDGEFVVFHEPSGKTHFLNAATARLLRELLGEPQYIGQVVAALSAGQDEADQQTIRETTEEMLLRLEDLGLVQAI